VIQDLYREGLVSQTVAAAMGPAFCAATIAPTRPAAKLHAAHRPAFDAGGAARK
jgi:hypothetical protein